MKILAHGINRVAMVIFNVLIVCSLIGAVALIPGDVASASGLGLVITILAGIIGWLLGSMERRSPGLIIDWTKKHKWVLWSFGGLIGVGTVVWQLTMVWSLSGYFGWDPTWIMNGAITTNKLGGTPGELYFSHSPNNFTLMYLYHLLAKSFGLTTLNQITLASNIMNVLVIDLAGLAMVMAVKRLNIGNGSVLIAVILYWSLIMIWPYAVIPYSDSWSLLIGGLLILTYSVIIKNRNRKIVYYLCVFAMGSLVAAGYLIKPSIIIYVLAVVVLFAISRHRCDLKKLVIVGVVAALGTLIISVPNKYVENHTQLVHIDRRLEYPLSHFLAMGMVGKGGYDPIQVKRNAEIKDPQKRNRYNWQIVKKETTNYVHHPATYFKFLFAKQIANTSEGTFGWGREGFFLGDPFNKTHLNVVARWQQRHFLNKEGLATADLAGLNIFAQLVWIITLGGLLLQGIKLDEKDSAAQILKYTILGGMLFLLIFEGGRSRYMMQFLPYVIIVAATNISKWYSHWIKENQIEEGELQ